MIIKADKEAIDLISQAMDGLLKSHWNQVLYIVNSILKSVEEIKEENEEKWLEKIWKQK